jgi:hypothetical protein
MVFLLNLKNLIMKKLILLLAIFCFGITSLQAQSHLKKDGTPDMRYKENKEQYTTPSNTNPDKVHVDEYQKKNGTAVEEHNRTAPNNTNKDNWSTKPNTNPETGEKGTVEPK